MRGLSFSSSNRVDKFYQNHAPPSSGRPPSTPNPTSTTITSPVTPEYESTPPPLPSAIATHVNSTKQQAQQQNFNALSTSSASSNGSPSTSAVLPPRTQQSQQHPTTDIKSSSPIPTSPSLTTNFSALDSPIPYLPPANNNHNSNSNIASSTAVKMMKKLSSTFRRKTSFSSNVFSNNNNNSNQNSNFYNDDATNTSIITSSDNDSTNMRTNINNNNQPSQRRKIISARAMTFSVSPSTNNSNNNAASKASQVSEIPFFRTDRKDPPKNLSGSDNPSLSSGNNKQFSYPRQYPPQQQPHAGCTHFDNETWGSDTRLSLPVSDINNLHPQLHGSNARCSHPSTQVPVPKIGNILKESTLRNIVQKGSGRPPRTPRHRYLSFDAELVRKIASSQADNISTTKNNNVKPKQYHYTSEHSEEQENKNTSNRNKGSTTTKSSGSTDTNGSNKSRNRSKRRWFLPLSESPDKPKVFNPTNNVPSFNLITSPRDKAEAKTLVSVCTYLEGEINRIEAHMHTHNNKSKNNNRHHCTNNCANNCELNSYLPMACNRLRTLLNMLEDRYDSVQDFYVKSEELSKAMGKFLNVTPDQFNTVMNSDNNENKVKSSVVEQQPKQCIDNIQQAHRSFR